MTFTLFPWQHERLNTTLTHSLLEILPKNTFRVVFWSLSCYKELKLTTNPFTGRTLHGLLIQRQNISLRSSGMRRKQTFEKSTVYLQKFSNLSCSIPANVYLKIALIFGGDNLVQLLHFFFHLIFSAPTDFDTSVAFNKAE